MALALALESAKSRALTPAQSVAMMLAMSLTLAGCSLEQLAIDRLADALAGSGKSFASDDDPELIRAAVPFSLKLIESLLQERPEHEGLLLAAASGFTQYTYAFVEEDADEAADRSLEAAEALRERARRLYRRARQYGLRGLESRHAGFEAALRADPAAALRATDVDDVPLLYWTAAAWGRAISLSKSDPDAVANQLIVEALIDRALVLDEGFGEGAIHAFLISYELARQGARGNAMDRARAHFDRAMALSGGSVAGPLVALAEAVAVQEQDVALFRSLLEQALAIDPDGRPASRLENRILQRRARWLLSRVEELFVESTAPADGG